jgi:long-chain fatty acid transport protein
VNINYRQLFIAILFVILSVPPIWAGGLNLYEVGSPDMGSAAAGRAALAQDASTAFGNPAGMTRLESSQVLLGIQEIILSSEFDIGRDTDTSLFGDAATGGDGGNIGGITPAGGLYFVLNPHPDLRAGLSVNSYAGLAIDYDDDWVGRYYVQEAEFTTININPALAYKVNDWLSLGAGANIIFSELSLKAAIRKLLTGDVQLDDTGGLLTGLKRRLALTQSAAGASVEGDGRIDYEDDAVGYGGNAGILLEPRKGTRIGVIYRSPVKLEFEDQVDIEDIGPILTSALESRGLLNAEVEMEITLPQEVLFSVYQEITDKLAIMANGGWQNWDDFGTSDVTVKGNETTEFTSDRRLKDTWHAALGLQYRVLDPTLLSLGFAYDSSPVSDNDRTPDLPVDQQLRYALGLQHDLSKDFTIGCAYEFVDLGDAKIDQERGLHSGRLQGDYNPNHIQVILANLIWRF